MEKPVNGFGSINQRSDGKPTTLVAELEYVVFDTETTGLGKSDRVIEIAFIAFKGGTILEEWRPGCTAPPDATR